MGHHIAQTENRSKGIFRQLEQFSQYRARPGTNFQIVFAQNRVFLQNGISIKTFYWKQPLINKT